MGRTVSVRRIRRYACHAREPENPGRHDATKLDAKPPLPAAFLGLRRRVVARGWIPVFAGMTCVLLSGVGDHAPQRRAQIGRFARAKGRFELRLRLSPFRGGRFQPGFAGRGEG